MQSSHVPLSNLIQKGSTYLLTEEEGILESNFVMVYYSRLSLKKAAQ